MKLKTTTPLPFYEVTGIQIAQIEVPPGTYTVELKTNPTGRNHTKWYVFTKPEEINSSFKGKTIGVAIEWVKDNSSISVVH